MQVLEITNISLSKRQTAERRGNQFRLPVCSWALSPGHTLCAWPAALLPACDAPCCQRCTHVLQEPGAFPCHNIKACVYCTLASQYQHSIQGQKHSGFLNCSVVTELDFMVTWEQLFALKSIVKKEKNNCLIEKNNMQFHQTFPSSDVLSFFKDKAMT